MIQAHIARPVADPCLRRLGAPLCQKSRSETFFTADEGILRRRAYARLRALRARTKIPIDHRERAQTAAEQARRGALVGQKVCVGALCDDLTGMMLSLPGSNRLAASWLLSERPPELQCHATTLSAQRARRSGKRCWSCWHRTVPNLSLN